MESIIKNTIPKQNFEKALFSIGEILFVELTNQQKIQRLTNDLRVYNSRIVPFSDEEEVMVNVTYAGIVDIQNRGFGASEGENVYYVDVSCSAQETKTVNGGYKAQMQLNKYLGMIRFILDSPLYIYLGLDPGVVSYKGVSKIQIYDVPFKGDSSFIKEGRLTFIAKVNECNEYEEGVEIEGNDTEVKLDLTDKGYKYKFNN